MMNPLDLVKTYGPTPLDELTARVPSEPDEVAAEINKLSSENVLQVKDGKKIIDKITEEQAKTSRFLVALTPDGMKKFLAGW